MRMSERSLTYEHAFAREVQNRPDLYTWIGRRYFTVNARLDLGIRLRHNNVDGYSLEITDGNYTDSYSGRFTVFGIPGMLTRLSEYIKKGGQFDQKKDD